MNSHGGELTVGVVASTRAWRNELQAYVRNHVSGSRHPDQHPCIITGNF